MSQHQAASGQFDRAVNPADGVGSLKQGPRTHPAHAEGRFVYNGADRDGPNGNPGLKAIRAYAEGGSARHAWRCHSMRWEEET